MNGAEITTIFANYGWPGVIAVIIITALVIFFRYFKRSNNETKQSMQNGLESITEKMTEKMAEQNDKIVSMISEQNTTLVTTLKETNEKLIEHILFERDKKHEESLDYRIDISEPLSDIVKEMRAEFKASRVSILEFHNTNVNLSGLGFLSYDMKYERQEIGVPAVSALVHNREISQLVMISKKIAENDKHVYIMNLLTEEDKHTLYDASSVLYDDLVIKLDASQLIFVGLYDYNTLKMLGILAIEYGNNKQEQIKYVNKHADDHIDKCAIYGSRISQLLTLPDSLQ